MWEVLAEHPIVVLDGAIYHPREVLRELPGYVL